MSVAHWSTAGALDQSQETTKCMSRLHTGYCIRHLCCSPISCDCTHWPAASSCDWTVLTQDQFLWQRLCVEISLNRPRRVRGKRFLNKHFDVFSSKYSLLFSALSVDFDMMKLWKTISYTAYCVLTPFRNVCCVYNDTEMVKYVKNIILFR